MSPIVDETERELRLECLSLRSRLEAQAYELNEMREYVTKREGDLREYAEDLARRVYVTFCLAIAVLSLVHLLAP